MAILTCPGCGRGGLRVPDGRRGKVTCPRCGAEWFHPETIELSEVEFRCAHSGARFIVQLSRRSPLHKFVVQAIKNTPPQPSKPLHRVDDGGASDLGHAFNGSADQLFRPRPAGLLTRLFGKATAIASATNPFVLSHEQANASPVAKRSTYDADQYNWNSFICPYCSATSFIKCAGGHLACDGTVELRSGRRFHQFFCGHAAFVEGTIKTIEANHRSFEAGDAPRPAASQSTDVTEKPAAKVSLPPMKGNI